MTLSAFAQFGPVEGLARKLFASGQRVLNSALPVAILSGSKTKQDGSGCVKVLGYGWKLVLVAIVWRLMVGFVAMIFFGHLVVAACNWSVPRDT